MDKKVEFMPFEKLADYDYGVKGFEIKFQDAIEDYLKANGIDAPWWKYYSRSIFHAILEIYITSCDVEILSNLHDLYRKIRAEVEERVVNNKPYDFKEGK